MSALHWIAADAPPDAFPPVETALTEPDGLLASGGDLSPERLLSAYQRGIFPWYESGQPVLWWSPDPRAFIPAAGLHISRSLKRRLRRLSFKVSFDTDFAAVVAGCAAPRRDGEQTWITPAMRAAYLALHQQGHAHSIEVRVEQQLVGGLYGVAIGRMFYAESMFSRVDDASKIALACLARQLMEWGFPGIDAQVQSAHLDTLGCQMLPRPEFLAINARFSALPGPRSWEFDPRLIDELRGR